MIIYDDILTSTEIILAIIRWRFKVDNVVDWWFLVAGIGRYQFRFVAVCLVDGKCNFNSTVVFLLDVVPYLTKVVQSYPACPDGACTTHAVTFARLRQFLHYSLESKRSTKEYVTTLYSWFLKNATTTNWNFKTHFIVFKP